jgi:hypothetical protein
MTTVLHPSDLCIAPTPAPELAPVPTATPTPTALATSTLRQALAELGHPTPRAAARVVPLEDRARLVIEMPPTLPWRVADAAVARTMREVRAAYPTVRLSDSRFEECRAGD